MIAKYKWLILAPAFAVALFLGPLQSTKAQTSTDGTGAEPAAAAQPDSVGKRTSAAGIEMPDTWQIAATLIGVLMLGAGGLVAFAKLKNATQRSGPGIVTLRQSIRLSGKQSLHAVQFDDKILLLGECDGTLQVLERTLDHTAGSDEAELLKREREDEGAVPRDMVIPRPARKRKSANAEGIANFNTLLSKARGGDVLV